MTSAIALDGTTRRILEEGAYLRRVARCLTHRADDADDLVGETVLRAYAARDRFDEGSCMRAWLSTILRRQFLTELSKQNRRRTRQATDAGLPIELAPSRARPQNQFVEEDFGLALEGLDDGLRRALDRLSPKYRRPLLLFVLEGLSYVEIAQRLGVAEGTVMSRIHRAKRRLAGSLPPTGGLAPAPPPS